MDWTETFPLLVISESEAKGETRKSLCALGRGLTNAVKSTWEDLSARLVASSQLKASLMNKRKRTLSLIRVHCET